MLDGLVSIIQNYWFIVDTDRVAAGQAGFFQMLRPICCIGSYCYSTSVFSLILFPPFSGGEPLVVTNDEFNGCGMQLRAERERLGYTRDQAAERADITSRYLAAIELGEKIPKADVLVKLIRGMGASANSVIYASQQQADDECERLARLFLQCTPRERKLIAAIIDTILDQHRQEDTPDEKA